MLEHLEMFASSQTNQSPYGKYDYGGMVDLRERQKLWLRNVIEIVAAVAGEITDRFVAFGPVENLILEQWTETLGFIEPNEKGRQSAKELKERFLELPNKTKYPWAYGFLRASQEYTSWSGEMLEFLRGVSPRWLELPVLGPVSQVIKL